MNEQLKTEFLKSRMIQLREKNNKTLSQMAIDLNVNKSTLSRVEKPDGSNFKTVDVYARMYCQYFKMSEQQTDIFLRGEKAVLVDTTALIKRPNILDELCEEYSCVFVPSFVIDDLSDIENKNPNDYGRLARQILKNIATDKRIHTKNYSIPTEAEEMVVDIANAVADELLCMVDIITYDYKKALIIKSRMSDDSKYRLLFLEEYVAFKQDLVNMSVINAINEYYADEYDDIVDQIGIKASDLNDEGFLNNYLADGTTLIISAVDNTEVPIKQRKEKIRWLINQGADVNKRDCGEKYLPPISHAIRNHDYEMFSFLYTECEANPNIGSRYPYDVGKVRCKNDGNMPLMIAAWENQIDIVRDLCADKRVSLNQQDGNGYTALMKACYWGNLECRELIEAANADTSILDHEGMSAQDRWDECMDMGRYKEREIV